MSDVNENSETEETETEETASPEENSTAEPAPNDESVIPKAALKQRLERERKAARNELLKKFGVDSEDAVAEAFKKLKEIEDASKSEQQRLIEERDQLKPKADLADSLAKRVEALSAAQYEALSEDDRDLVDALSNESDGTVNHDRRIDVIAALTKKKRIGKTPVPAGSSTSRAAPAPKGDAAPEPGSPESHYQAWSKMDSPMLKNAYFEKYASQIKESASYKAAAS